MKGTNQMPTKTNNLTFVPLTNEETLSITKQQVLRLYIDLPKRKKLTISLFFDRKEICKSKKQGKSSNVNKWLTHIHISGNRREWVLEDGEGVWEDIHEAIWDRLDDMGVDHIVAPPTSPMESEMVEDILGQIDTVLKTNDIER